MRRLDLRGEVCPYTLVKTLLSLEELDPGTELAVVLDYAPAVDNVPRSLRLYGHEVLEVVREEAAWVVRVRKEGASRCSD